MPDASVAGTLSGVAAREPLIRRGEGDCTVTCSSRDAGPNPVLEGTALAFALWTNVPYEWWLNHLITGRERGGDGTIRDTVAPIPNSRE